MKPRGNAARAQHTLESLRANRVFRPRDVAIAPALTKLVEATTDQRRRLGDLARAWVECVPESVGQGVRPVSIARGQLTVAASDKAAEYKIDQWLRCGGLDTLRRYLSGALNGHKVVMDHAMNNPGRDDRVPSPRPRNT